VSSSAGWGSGEGLRCRLRELQGEFEGEEIGVSEDSTRESHLDIVRVNDVGLMWAVGSEAIQNGRIRLGDDPGGDSTSLSFNDIATKSELAVVE
jgi:hypothetical protein